MELGDKYICYSRSGKRQERTWIESILDIERYVKGNVFNEDGKCLCSAKRQKRLHASLDDLERSQLTFRSKNNFVLDQLLNELQEKASEKYSPLYDDWGCIIDDYDAYDAMFDRDVERLGLIETPRMFLDKAVSRKLEDLSIYDSEDDWLIPTF